MLAIVVMSQQFVDYFPITESQCQNHHCMVTSNSCQHCCELLVQGKNIANILVMLCWLYKFPYKVIQSQLTGPEFVWLLPGWYRSGWWNISDASCTAEEMKNGLEHSLAYAANSVITANMSRVMVSGKV